MDDTNVLVPYMLRFEKRSGYLMIRIDGVHDSANLTIHYWDQINRICKELNYKKILVVERLRRQVSLEEAFNVACRFNYEAFEGIKIAFVDMLPKHSEINEFTARMSANHGLNIKVFEQIPSAREWLLAV